MIKFGFSGPASPDEPSSVSHDEGEEISEECTQLDADKGVNGVHARANKSLIQCKDHPSPIVRKKNMLLLLSVMYMQAEECFSTCLEWLEQQPVHECNVT